MDAVLFFGLGCLEALATKFWNALDNSQRLVVRTLALEAMRLSSAEEASFVRNKKATLLAHVALREFPQRWPNFVDECLMLRGISSQGDASFELGLLALAELAEDCQTETIMVVSRRSAELTSSRPLTQRHPPSSVIFFLLHSGPTI